jgi:replicative DNA helicase
LAKKYSKTETPLGLILIDYLQLMRLHREKGDSVDQAIGEVSRGLKALAKELAIPVVVLSQLNRSLERRDDKRPIMSDLRDSGNIEQDADAILFIYRDEVYARERDDLQGIAEIIVAKQRNGPIGTVTVGFQADCMRFHDLQHQSAAMPRRRNT